MTAAAAQDAIVPSSTAPPTATERADLLAALGEARHFLRLTVRDLDDDQARQRTTASTLCLAGILKHVAAVERGWTAFVVEGTSAMSFEGEAAAESHRRQFRPEDGETVGVLLEDYARVAEATDELVRTLPDLDLSHPLPPAPWFPPGATWSARRVLLHIIAETAQHAGHADIVRESLDGARTMG
ncbi:MAG: DinB family protein [Acidimicrobiales bacterium]